MAEISYGRHVIALLQKDLKILMFADSNEEKIQIAIEQGIAQVNSI